MAEKITIGYHSFGTCTTGFATSLAGVVRYSGSLIGSLLHVPSPYVTEARNKIVAQWLQKTKSEYLLMMDVDLQFQEDAVLQTYFVAKQVGAQVLFGCYALGDFRPSLFGPPADSSKQLPTVIPDLQAEQVYEVYAGATGWLMMSRTAAETVKAANSGRHWPWFDHDIEQADDLRSGELYKEENNTIRIGEDFSFSKRAREAGLKIYGTTLPLLIHEKYQPLMNHFMAPVAQKRGLPMRGNTNAVGSGQVQQDVLSQSPEVQQEGQGEAPPTEQPESLQEVRSIPERGVDYEEEGL